MTNDTKYIVYEKVRVILFLFQTCTHRAAGWTWMLSHEKFTCLADLLVLRSFAYFEHHHVKHLLTILSINKFVDTWIAFLTQDGKQVQPDQALDRAQEFDQLFKFAA